VSTLLRAWSEGDQRALEKLTPIVCDKLHRLARRYMKRERPGHSLQTTALVNEAYMRLVDYKRMQWQNRAQASMRGCSEPWLSLLTYVLDAQNLNLVASHNLDISSNRLANALRNSAGVYTSNR